MSFETVVAVLERTVAFSTAHQPPRAPCPSRGNCAGCSAGASLILTAAAAPLALAVTEWENIRHITGKNRLLCHQSTCHSHQHSLWLPHSAFLCRVHGCAFFTVEHLWERFKVLQRSHHPKQREGMYLHGYSARRLLLWKTESHVHKVISSLITQLRYQNMGYFMQEQYSSYDKWNSRTEHTVSGFWSIRCRLAHLLGRVKEHTLQRCPTSYGRTSES